MDLILEWISKIINIYMKQRRAGFNAFLAQLQEPGKPNTVQGGPCPELESVSLSAWWRGSLALRWPTHKSPESIIPTADQRFVRRGLVYPNGWHAVEPGMLCA